VRKLVSERRLIVCAILACLVLLLLAGIAVTALLAISSARNPTSSCLESIEELPVPPFPDFGSLPPLEVVRTDLPTMERVGAWLHWYGGWLRVRSMSLDPGGSTLWLGMDSGLAQWDLNALNGALIDIGGVGAIAGIVPTGPEQFWAVGSGSVIRYDQGKLETLPGSPGYAYNLPVQSGLDEDGALWVGSYVWGRCMGYPGDWRCGSSVEYREGILSHMMACTPPLTSLDVSSFRYCVASPRRTEFIPLDPPTCTDWQAVSGSVHCVTWDQDCSGQLVLLSVGSHEIVRTLPWPSGVNMGDVLWVTHGSDQVWLFDGALWLFEAGRWRYFEWPYETPTELAADPQRGGVWAGVPGLGLVHVSADAVRLYHPRDQMYALPVERGYTPIYLTPIYLLPPGPGWLAVASLAETTDGRIWAGTDGGGLWVFDEEEKVWQPTELTQAFVDVLLADPDGGLWLGTRDSGVAHYDGKDGWQWWRTYTGLASDVITALALDQQGRLWAGTADAGLMRFDGETWERLETEGVASRERITALVVDREGRVFFGYSDGVGMVSGEQPVAPLVEGFHLTRPVALALDGEGGLWASDGYALYAFEGEAYWGPHSEGMGKLQEILFDGAGRLWAGGSALRVFDATTGEWHTVSYTDDVYALLEDSRGRIWVGENWGVSMYDPALGELEFLE
jgi:ligand-binding sensor domain-containing protein